MSFVVCAVSQILFIFKAAIYADFNQNKIQAYSEIFKSFTIFGIKNLIQSSKALYSTLSDFCIKNMINKKKKIAFFVLNESEVLKEMKNQEG